MSIQQEKFKAIADKIRKNTNATEAIKPSAFADKVDEVYKAGKQAEYDAFWDTFQQNGKRTSYYLAFPYWEDACYNPKYPVVTAPDGIPTNMMFDSAKITDTRVDIFVNCERVDSMFRVCRNLKTVKRLVLTERTTTFNNFATSCVALENFNVEGVINGNIDFHWSEKLTHESLMKIINCLADKTADTSGAEMVCTLGTTNLEKLSATEIAVATEKGWTLA